MTTDEIIEAAKAGDANRVRAMLAAHPELAAVRASSGESPLMAALYRGHAQVVALVAHAIESAGGDLDLFAAAATGRGEAVARAIATGDVNRLAYDGWSALHLAAFFGHRNAAEVLIRAGALVNAVSGNALKNTPLHAATAGGHDDVALLLIERGADVNATDAGGHTPLHIAAENGRAAVVRALLERGADPYAVDLEEKTPLSRAAARNHAGIVDQLNLGS